MANKIRFSSLAQQELEDASEWYEKQLLGLGESFSEKVYEAANIISNNPDLYQQIKSKFYECVIHDFPYIVVYEYLKKESVVNILHVFHTSRNPKLKYKRG